jgi:hypothetical protein
LGICISLLLMTLALRGDGARGVWFLAFRDEREAT